MIMVILGIILTIAAVFIVGAVALVMAPPMIVAMAIVHVFGEGVSKAASAVAFAAGVAMWWYIDEQDSVPNGFYILWWGVSILLACYIILAMHLQRTRLLVQSVVTAALFVACAVCITVAAHATHQQAIFDKAAADASAVEAQYSLADAERPCSEVAPLCDATDRRFAAQHGVASMHNRAVSYSLAAGVLGVAGVFPAIGIVGTIAGGRRREYAN